MRVFNPIQSAIAPLLVALILTMPMPVQAGLDTAFVPREVLVTDPTAGPHGIWDPEYDNINGQFCWVDDTGRLWLGYMDPATGEYIPPNGRGTLIATDAITAEELGNGPEWVYTSSGPQIVYTRLMSGSKFLARAYFSNGLWKSTTIAMGGGRLLPIGSQDRGDSSPTIAYQGPSQNGERPLYVRTLNDASTEQMIPSTRKYNTAAARPIPGTNAVIFSRPMPENARAKRQVFVYDRDTLELEQLTFDEGNKKAVFMWQAPEYDNEYIFFVMVNERVLSIYRYLDRTGRGDFKWTLVQNLRPPSEGPYIWSPEPFVYEGKTYISMTTSTTYEQRNFDVPSEVWLTDIDPVDPTWRRLSGNVEINRKDPEVYISEQGPYVYVSWFDENRHTSLYRLDTGIGPQAQ